jgi:hypothetical protein
MKKQRTRLYLQAGLLRVCPAPNVHDCGSLRVSVAHTVAVRSGSRLPVPAARPLWLGLVKAGTSFGSFRRPAESGHAVSCPHQDFSEAVRANLRRHRGSRPSRVRSAVSHGIAANLAVVPRRPRAVRLAKRRCPALISSPPNLRLCGNLASSTCSVRAARRPAAASGRPTSINFVGHRSAPGSWAQGWVSPGGYGAYA